MEDSDNEDDHVAHNTSSTNDHSTNPDEIMMEEEDDSEEEPKEDKNRNKEKVEENSSSVNSSNNPEEIVIEDDDDDDDNNNNDDDGNNNGDNKDSIDTTEEENKGTNEGKDIEISDNNNQSSELKRKLDENSNKTEDSTQSSRITKFLALDKCLPRRQFLQIIDIPTNTNTNNRNLEASTESTSATMNSNNESKEGENQRNEPSTYDEPQFSFEYDTEWLAITRAFSHYPLFESNPVNIPSISQMKSEIDTEKKWIQEHLSEINLNIYDNSFVQTAPYYPNNSELDKPYENPQTKKFCEQISINLPPF